MPEQTEFVTNGAILRCSEGTLPTPLIVVTNTNIKIGGFYAANENDKVPIVNISPFGICLKLTKSTPIPCVPAPTQWTDIATLKIKGAHALIASSCINCSIGGKIQVITSGQGPSSPQADLLLQGLEKETKKQLDKIKIQQEAVGEASFVEGMIPIWGSGRDLVNSIQTGDTISGTVAAGFLILDSVSIGAGLVTSGIATAVIQGIKGPTRVGVKAVSKRGRNAVINKIKKQVANADTIAEKIAQLTTSMIPSGQKMATGKAKISSVPNVQLIPDPPPANMTNAEKGIYGEHVADIRMNNEGHTKMNGALTKSTDPPLGQGIDGVWKGANPPPDYIIVEAKYGSSQQGNTEDGKQMSDDWILGNDRLKKAVGRKDANSIKSAMEDGKVERRLIIIDEMGNHTVYLLDIDGNYRSNRFKKPKK